MYIYIVIKNFKTYLDTSIGTLYKDNEAECSEPRISYYLLKKKWHSPL